MAKKKHHPTPKAQKAYIANMKKGYTRLQSVLKKHGHLDANNKLK